MLLVIETATASLSLALLDGDDVAGEHHEIVGRGHAERLMPALAALLGDRRPSAIAVDCGPGSFTGIRVGLAAAQGLRIAWGIEASGFSSTALIASAVTEADRFAVALGGGHGELFVEMFETDPLRSIAPLRSLAPGAAAASVDCPLVVGDGAAALVAARGWGEAVEAWPRAANCALLPPQLRQAALKPVYGRAPDARLPT